jgi:hypothetical protein
MPWIAIQESERACRAISSAQLQSYLYFFREKIHQRNLYFLERKFIKETKNKSKTMDFPYLRLEQGAALTSQSSAVLH